MSHTEVPSFQSEAKPLGDISFPAFSGLRCMMLPFRLEDLSTVPYYQYRSFLARMLELSEVRATNGTAYLTIDEALIPAGETHRRPGLHVDGVGPDGSIGGWAGGSWGRGGMCVAASHYGCDAWTGEFRGAPGNNGDCAHLSKQAADANRIPMAGGVAFFVGPLGVHASVPMAEDTARQFVRLSFPSNAPWYEGYTWNPKVPPAGPIHPARVEQMGFRSKP